MLGVTLIRIPAWGTANIVELIWLLGGITTVIYTCSHLPELARDLAAAAGSSRRALREVAWGYLRREVIRILQGVCISVIGIYASVTPPAIPSAGDFVTPTGIILTCVLFLQGLLVVGQSFWDWRTRRNLRHLLEAERPH